MADLDVQPKKKGSILPWILLALGLIALIFFLVRGCNNDDAGTNTTNTDTTNTTGAAANTTGAAVATSSNWSDVDFNAPAATYDEITGNDISVRGNNNYSIYGVGENILFDTDKSTIRSGAEQNLEQIAASIAKRHSGAQVRIYGFTDAVGSAGYNKELAEQRAESVRNWLVSNGNIAADRLSIEPVGEAHPTATNATAEGRQQNRRVEIVARSNA